MRIEDLVPEHEIPAEMMISEFARVVGCSPRTIWNYVYRGYLVPRIDMRKRRWYSRLDAVVLRAILHTKE